MLKPREPHGPGAGEGTDQPLTGDSSTRELQYGALDEGEQSQAAGMHRAMHTLCCLGDGVAVLSSSAGASLHLSCRMQGQNMHLATALCNSGGFMAMLGLL